MPLTEALLFLWFLTSLRSFSRVDGIFPDIMNYRGAFAANLNRIDDVSFTILIDVINHTMRHFSLVAEINVFPDLIFTIDGFDHLFLFKETHFTRSFQSRRRRVYKVDRHSLQGVLLLHRRSHILYKPNLSSFLLALVSHSFDSKYMS